MDEVTLALEVPGGMLPGVSHAMLKLLQGGGTFGTGNPHCNLISGDKSGTTFFQHSYSSANPSIVFSTSTSRKS